MIRRKGRRWRRSAQEWIDYHQRVELRFYINGHMFLGPLSLTDLAMIVKYGGYTPDEEHSIVHIPSFAVGHASEGFDVTVTRHGELP